ncbi:MAG TPA: hypothetical protein DD738_04385 [Ruminiclostridium sp.]|nr:hypothetical protein [Ruminiclostridium sp.]
MKNRLTAFLAGAIFIFSVACSNYIYFESQFIAGNGIGNARSSAGYFKEDYNSVSNEPQNGGEITSALYNSGYLYNDDTDSGLNKDIIEEISRRLELDIVQKVMPRARIYSMLEDGSLPISVSTVETSSRAEYSWFIPYFVEKNYVLVRKDAGLKTEEELLKSRGIKIGIIRGYYYGLHYNGLIQKLKERHLVVEAKDTEDIFKMMKEGWIQVTFGIPAAYLYYFEKMDFGQIAVMDWAPDEKPLKRCISLSKQYFTFHDLEQFQKVVLEMKDDGTLYKIYSRYLPENVAKGMCEFQ